MEAFVNMLEHLQSRHLDMELHKVWIDEEEWVATLPLYSPVLHELIGYQRYRPEGGKKIQNNQGKK